MCSLMVGVCGSYRHVRIECKNKGFLFFKVLQTTMTTKIIHTDVPLQNFVPKLSI